MDRLGNLAKLLFNGYFFEVLREMKRRLYSNEISVGLSCCPTKMEDISPSQHTLRLRKLKENDFSILQIPWGGNMSFREFKDISIRLLMIKANINTCYVAEMPDGVPCHIFWLISSNENDKISKLFQGGFPPLKNNEALLEGLYTPKSIRGKGVMLDVIKMIIRKSLEDGDDRLVAFVRSNNSPSLKNFKKAGFSPYLIRKDKWRLFRRKLSFVSIPN